MSVAIDRPRALLLQHAIYPYRRRVFEALSEDLDLTVLFCIPSKAFRRWETSAAMAGAPFEARILRSFRMGPIVLNPSLFRDATGDRYDALLFGSVDFITIPQVAALVAAGARTGAPLVACEEFFPTAWYLRDRPLVTRLALATRRLVHRRCAAFVTWNGAARRHLLSQGIPAAKIFSGPHWYPPPGPVSESAASPFPGKRIVVALAYFLPRKGLDVLVEAFRSLPHDDAVLVIGGSGAVEDELRAAAAGDERIHFPGYLDERQKNAYLAGAYVFVHPTLWDPWGLVVNEALYRGLPVVVSDAAGCADHLVDGNGIVVPAGDAAALTEALARLLDDPAERDAMAARSAEVVGRCTLEAMVDPVVAAVRSVTGRPAGAPGFSVVAGR
jgi:glycosyltransferase involved in cell wall biosynthesis